MRRKLFLSGVVLFILLWSSLVVSVDAASMWSRTYAGIGEEGAYALAATSDGGYALAGYTKPVDVYSKDFWLVKTDADGIMEWNRTYGDTADEVAYALAATEDGGYALAGYTRENVVDNSKFFLIKTDALGNMEWNRTYETPLSDEAGSIIATSDGGYALAGRSMCIKTNAVGDVEWNQTYDTWGFSSQLLTATSDGGYAIAQTTGSGDFFLAKTDALGNMLWNKTYGGAGYDWVYAFVATSDGGFALAGTFNSIGPFSTESVSVGTAEAGTLEDTEDYSDSNGADFWLVKTDSAGIMQWNQTYGGTDADMARSLVETFDGGYALAGGHWFVKTDALGNMEWNKTYVGYARALVAASDGGYAIGGIDNSDFWLVKTDEFGVVPEYSSWFVPALVLTASAFIIINKKRLLHKRS